VEVRVFSTAPSTLGLFSARPARGLAFVAAVFALSATGATAQTPSGQYRVRGTNPDGSGYGGTVVITPTSDTTCRITWDTGSTSVGICMVAGKTVAASYSLAGRIGLVLYQMQPDGVLNGVWTVADQPGGGTEILTPAR
jgi:hypothetical protein